MKNRKIIIILKNAIFLFLGISFIGVAGIMIYVATAQIPDFKSFEARLIENSTKIYDRTGEVVLYDFHTNTKRTEIPFSEMGKWLPQATTAIEDSSFYNHNGVRPISIMRAVLVNITSGKTKQGGSTITQQVIKNSLLTQENKGGCFSL
jgi:penicillin-binding protein 1A